jgi:hypothetical protein
MLNRLEESRCEKIKNMCSGQNRLVICREGSQDQTSGAVVLKEEDHICFRMFELPNMSDRFERYPYIMTSSCVLVTT